MPAGSRPTTECQVWLSYQGRVDFLKAEKLALRADALQLYSIDLNYTVWYKLLELNERAGDQAGRYLREGSALEEPPVAWSIGLGRLLCHRRR